MGLPRKPERIPRRQDDKRRPDACSDHESAKARAPFSRRMGMKWQGSVHVTPDA
jgi:hypothetical protein